MASSPVPGEPPPSPFIDTWPASGKGSLPAGAMGDSGKRRTLPTSPPCAPVQLDGQSSGHDVLSDHALIPAQDGEAGTALAKGRESGRSLPDTRHRPSVRGAAAHHQQELELWRCTTCNAPGHADAVSCWKCGAAPPPQHQPSIRTPVQAGAVMPARWDTAADTLEATAGVPGLGRQIKSFSMDSAPDKPQSRAPFPDYSDPHIQSSQIPSESGGVKSQGRLRAFDDREVRVAQNTPAVADSQQTHPADRRLEVTQKSRHSGRAPTRERSAPFDAMEEAGAVTPSFNDSVQENPIFENVENQKETYAPHLIQRSVATICEPGSPMSPMGDKEPEILYCKAKNIVKCLEFELKRKCSVPSVPTFIVFLVLYTTSVMLSYNFGDNGEIRQIQESVMDEVFLDQTSKAVAGPRDFYQWIELMAVNLFQADGNVEPGSVESSILGDMVHNSAQDWVVGPGAVQVAANVPLHWLVIRQQRARLGSCSNEEARVIKEDVQESITAGGCVEKYDPSRLNGTAFGTMTPILQANAYNTGNPFVSDGVKRGAGWGMPPFERAAGLNRVYYDADEQFTVLFPYTMNKGNVSSVVRELSKIGWIDGATQFICVQTLVFSSSKGAYLLVRFVIEFEYTGMRGRVSTNADVFWLFLRHSSALYRCLWILDMVFAVYLCIIMHDISRHVYSGVRLGHGIASFGFWEFLMVLQFGCLLGSLVYRFMLWSDADRLNHALEPVELYDQMAQYQFKFVTSKYICGATLWLSWMRWLEFLRLDARLNAVTETVRLGGSDLVSLSGISIILFMPFAFFGHLLYGWHLEAFKTMSDTIVWLLLQFFTAALEEYHEMSALQPLWTPIYVTMFFLLVWLVILNILIGILATGFAAAAANSGDSHWSVQSIREDMAQMVGDPDEEEFKDVAEETPCVTSFLFLRGGAAISVERLTASANAMKAYIKEEVRAEREKREARGGGGQSYPVIVTPTDLASDELGDKGWRLGVAGTAWIFKVASARGVESFAEAEQEKRRGEQLLLRSMDDVKHGQRREAKKLRERMQQSSEALQAGVQARLDHTSTTLQAQFSARNDSLRRQMELNDQHLNGRADGLSDQIHELRVTLVALTRELSEALGASSSGLRAQLESAQQHLESHVTTAQQRVDNLGQAMGSQLKELQEGGAGVQALHERIERINSRSSRPPPSSDMPGRNPTGPDPGMQTVAQRPQRTATGSPSRPDGGQVPHGAQRTPLTTTIGRATALSHRSLPGLGGSDRAGSELPGRGQRGTQSPRIVGTQSPRSQSRRGLRDGAGASFSTAGGRTGGAPGAGAQWQRPAAGGPHSGTVPQLFESEVQSQHDAEPVSPTARAGVTASGRVLNRASSPAPDDPDHDSPKARGFSLKGELASSRRIRERAESKRKAAEAAEAAIAAGEEPPSPPGSARRLSPRHRAGSRSSVAASRVPSAPAGQAEQDPNIL